MRKLLIAAAVLIAVLVAADRIAVAAAENQIGARVAATYGLPDKPRVAIAGFPFLTQVVTGDYRQISVHATGVQAGGATLRWLSARLTGVHVSLPQVLGHGAGTVTASRATGSALIGFAELDQRLPPGVRLSQAGHRLRVSGELSEGGVRLPVSATVALRVTPVGIQIASRAVRTAGRRLPVYLARRYLPRLSFDIPLRTLPLHLRVTSVAVTSAGLRIGASAHDVHFAAN
ncbi:MAG TPA: DUF2993 domain-containing protein [Streptosporangiaceae bacterium]